MTAPPDPRDEIVLVEDNPNDVKLTLHAFERHRVANRVRVLRDGAEALDFAFCRGEFAGRDPGSQPKIILLDLKLPKVDGLEVLRQLKGDPRTRTIPVAILTSSSQERDVLAGYALGANSYIVKPVDFEQFVEATRVVGLYWLLVNHLPPPPAAE
jgi:two-component system response regulator